MGTVNARARWSCSCGGRLEVAGASPAAIPPAARCAACGVEHPLRAHCVTGEGGLVGCIACGHTELFTRKRFPQTIGLIVVLVAAVLAPFTYYISLLAAAAIDFVLYLVIRDEVACYVCRATHQGFAAEPRHPRFDREIEERLRYGSRAVMGKPMRPTGTANAPEPEH